MKTRHIQNCCRRISNPFRRVFQQQNSCTYRSTMQRSGQWLTIRHHRNRQKDGIGTNHPKPRDKTKILSTSELGLPTVFKLIAILCRHFGECPPCAKILNIPSKYTNAACPWIFVIILFRVKMCAVQSVPSAN